MHSNKEYHSATSVWYLRMALVQYWLECAALWLLCDDLCCSLWICPYMCCTGCNYNKGGVTFLPCFGRSALLLTILSRDKRATIVSAFLLTMITFAALGSFWSVTASSVYVLLLLFYCLLHITCKGRGKYCSEEECSTAAVQSNLHKVKLNLTVPQLLSFLLRCTVDLI